MTVKDLINKINKVDYLDSAQKKQWFFLIPKMNPDELGELAGIIVETEKEKERMVNVRDFMLNGMSAAFTAINRAVIDNAKNSKK